jgi:protein ImuB
LRGLGFSVRAALAPTPGAAWAFARYDAAASDGLAVTPLELRSRLRHLPVAGLRVPPTLADEMTRFGLGRIGDLYEFARAGLIAHFGSVLARRLDQALGRLAEPITPARPVAPLRARLAFVEPIATVEAAGLSLRNLLVDLAGALEARGLGVRRLELAVYRADGAVRRLPTDIEPALREPDALHRLMAPHLDKLGLDAGVEIMVLSAAQVEPLPEAALELDEAIFPRSAVGRAGNLSMGRRVYVDPRHAAITDRHISRVSAIPTLISAEPANSLLA